MAAKSTDKEVVLALYERTAKVTEIFWDWRHKLLAFGTSSITVLIGAAGLVQHSGIHQLLSLFAGIAGALIGGGMIWMDLRNQRILNHSYDTARIERELNFDGVFTGFPRGGWISYSRVMSFIGGVFGGTTLAAGVAFWRL